MLTVLEAYWFNDEAPGTTAAGRSAKMWAAFCQTHRNMSVTWECSQLQIVSIRAIVRSERR
jgi:hypothetical protein